MPKQTNMNSPYKGGEPCCEAQKDFGLFKSSSKPKQGIPPPNTPVPLGLGSQTWAYWVSSSSQSVDPPRLGIGRRRDLRNYLSCLTPPFSLWGFLTPLKYQTEHPVQAFSRKTAVGVLSFPKKLLVWFYMVLPTAIVYLGRGPFFQKVQTSKKGGWVKELQGWAGRSLLFQMPHAPKNSLSFYKQSQPFNQTNMFWKNKDLTQNKPSLTI